MKEAEIINVNYRGSINDSLNLHDLKLLFPNSKLSMNPFQLTVKDEKGTMLFFRTGKFRLMGFKSENDLDAMLLVNKYTCLLTNNVPSLILQSMTVKAKFEHCLNLYMLSYLIPESILELELFPALTIHKYKPIKVNVFASGTIIMCGIKDYSFSNVILKELKPFLCECVHKCQSTVKLEVI